MKAAFAFVLNLDAELELERGVRYQPTKEIIARVEGLARAMRPGLPPASVVLDPLGEAAPPDAQPIAWCPTTRALRSIRAAGLSVPRVPDLTVLTRVNARPFAFELAPDELAGALLVRDVDAARAALERPGEWLLKRCFGVSGRGQRRVRGGQVSAADTSFVAASIENDGALVIEPRVVITRELSVHAWIAGGTTHVRSIREQTTDAHGAFVRSDHVRDLEASIREPLVDGAVRVGEALIAAGYEGPFGVDAYLHRGPGDAPLSLRTLSEINARYCMGWDDVDGWLAPTR